MLTVRQVLDKGPWLMFDPGRSLRGIVVIALVVLGAGPAAAKMAAGARPQSGYENAVSFGPSIGAMFDRDAWFWGASTAYGRVWSDRWSSDVSLAWDRETERRAAAGDKVVETFTGIVSANYALTPKLALGTGLSKGIADDDNPAHSMSFADGDWGTGVIFSYAAPRFPGLPRSSIICSFSFEYNITQDEYSISLDLTLAYSF